MTQHQTRFGGIDIVESQRWTCAEPLGGFDDLSAFALLHAPEQGPFVWLQSLELPDLAFLLVDAGCFGLRYQGIEPNDDAPACVMVIVPRHPGEVLRVHRLAPLLFDVQAGTFIQQVFEPDQVVGDGRWSDEAAHPPRGAWASRVVEMLPAGQRSESTVA